MKSKIHIVMRNDLVILPPMQSLITVLLEKGVQVHFLGKCSDIESALYDFTDHCELVDRGQTLLTGGWCKQNNRAVLIAHAVVVIALDVVAVLHGVAGKVKLFKGGFYISVRILVCSFKADRIINMYGR